MSYTPTTWVDGETPVNAENLNKLEQAVQANDTAINEINTARANGEFDGKDGITPDVTLDQGTGLDGRKNVTITVSATDDNGITMTQSATVRDGKTPVRGVDYWTDEDKEEIVDAVTPYAVTEEMIQQVIATLATPVFGRVDEYNNIIIAGNLVPGNYTLKYENADGTVTTIGGVTVTPDADTIVTIPLNLQLGKIDTSTGEIVTTENYIYSDEVPVVAGRTYVLSGTNVCAQYKICYYDAAGAYMSVTPGDAILLCGDTGILGSGSVVVPLIDNAAFFRVRAYCYYYGNGYADGVAITIPGTTLTYTDA